MLKILQRSLPIFVGLLGLCVLLFSQSSSVTSVVAQGPTAKAKPKENADDILPPKGPATPAHELPIDLNELDLKAIQKELGINTKPLVDKKDPLLPVVVDALRNGTAAPSGPSESTKAPRLYSNARKVAIAYELTTGKKAPLKTVELWCQTAGGRWQLQQRATETKSPLQTELPGEGLYGCRLIFESNSGRRSPDLTATTLPEVEVEIDLTPPQVEKFLVVPCETNDKSLVVSCEASDRNLDPRSSFVEYSSDGKQWSAKVANGSLEYETAVVRTDGKIGRSYSYQIEPILREPTPLHVRVTLGDLAGNKTTVQTTHPVMLGALLPQGKIISVQPVRDTSR